jgi:hypothetical protein
MSELELTELDFQYDIYNSRQKLFVWYSEEIKINPEFKVKIRENYRKLSLNLGEKQIITSFEG